MNKVENTMAVVISICTAIVLIFAVILYAPRKPKVEYHMELINDDHVKLYDEDFKLIKTTTLDSIGYYITEDNI